MKMQGIYAIPPTPFDKSGAIDWNSFRKTIEFCLKCESDGIVAPVNASEAPWLTDEERETIVAETVKVVDNAVAVVAGVSGVSTGHAVRYATKAMEAGADSVIAMPPHHASDSYIFDYFALIAEVAQKPVWIQNNKPPACPTIATPTIVRILKEVQHASWVKEESAFPGQVISRLVAEAGDDLEGVMGGMGGRFLLDEYQRGACGSMPSCHLADACKALWSALDRGDELTDGIRPVSDKARVIWERMLPALNFEFMFSISAYKMTLYKRGIISDTFTRSTLCRPLDSADVIELDTILARISDLLII